LSATDTRTEQGLEVEQVLPKKKGATWKRRGGSGRWRQRDGCAGGKALKGRRIGEEAHDGSGSCGELKPDEPQGRQQGATNLQAGEGGSRQGGEEPRRRTERGVATPRRRQRAQRQREREQPGEDLIRDNRRRGVLWTTLKESPERTEWCAGWAASATSSKTQRGGQAGQIRTPRQGEGNFAGIGRSEERRSRTR